MGYYFGKQDMPDLARAQDNCVLESNGLGGYASVTCAGSVNRCDQGPFVAAVSAPNERITMVHRLYEELRVGPGRTTLSTQVFADRKKPEEGYRHLAGFSLEDVPEWWYQVGAVAVRKQLYTARGTNAAAVVYELENRAEEPCALVVEPFLKFAPKEQALQEKKEFTYDAGAVTDGSYTMYLKTNGTIRRIGTKWQMLAYPEDAKDGRADRGLAACCCRIALNVAAGKTERLEIVFSLDSQVPDAKAVADSWLTHQRELDKRCCFDHPVARELSKAADAFIVRRDSTDGKTILAGYPLFSDWGRDTMIALTGCTLVSGRYEDAKSILRTFLTYEKDGLVPNLFPEGKNQPMYNTVDAALLLIDCVWQYVKRTGDTAFVREAWPVMEHIIACYRKGTHHAIGMDNDGLIFAGGGLDQVTWMDVCVDGILPTPRHGKPVEVNAYWYNALRIMDLLAREAGLNGADYAELAETVRKSFVEKFYIPEKGYLRDVISGTDADEQLRCNQIWAVSMPFTMLEPEQEKSVVENVYRHLYTPCGLRTLSPEDSQYQPFYGGAQLQRDLAYHQGTTWVFPLGAYYLAWLKVNGNTPEAARVVRQQLGALVPMLRQGCLGQLPEIYDGAFPKEGKGCFAQAWSVGEMLRVFEALDKIEKK